MQKFVGGTDQNGRLILKFITVVAGTLMGYLLVRILSANGLTYFQYAFPFIPLLIYGVCLIITPIIISAICLKIQCRNSLVERIKMAD